MNGEVTMRVLQLTRRLSFVVHADERETAQAVRLHPDVCFFSSELPAAYERIAKDFGPVSIAVVHDFCKELRAQHDLATSPRLRYVCHGKDPQHVANAVFLLATFLVMDQGFAPDDAAARFKTLEVPLFRDATLEDSSYNLSVLQVLRGLSRASGLGWCRLGGCFDKERYARIIADAATLSDLSAVSSSYAPESIAAATDQEVFEDHPSRGRGQDEGDFAVPSTKTVQRFLDACDEAGGLVRTHTDDSAATLICCHLVRRFHFTAAEAIGYVRLCRPGSVRGVHQHFLEGIAIANWDGNRPYASRSQPPSPTATAGPAVLLSATSFAMSELSDALTTCSAGKEVSKEPDTDAVVTAGSIIKARVEEFPRMKTGMLGRKGPLKGLVLRAAS
mmetsp:Transcript_17099/g.33603  ORF Transcript_17099/g.33603 Transcript_17099/m.33603 type:complete len:390 (-) Transcript_17099:76-1245(-)